MKKRIFLVIVILIVIICAFLIKIAINLNKPGSSVQIAAGKVEGDLKYEIHDDYTQGGFDASKRGYYINTYKMPDSPWYYIITMGEQSTGGCSLEITEVKIDKNNNVEVIVEEKEPKSNESVITVLTYPTICIEFNKMPNSIKIVNTNGEAFKKLNWNSDTEEK